MEKLGLMGIRMERMERSPHGVGPSGRLLSEEGPVWKIASNEEVFKKFWTQKNPYRSRGFSVYALLYALYVEIIS